MNQYKCKEISAYIKKNPWTCILAFILLVQFLLISICNITLIDNNIDCDNAKLFVHTMKMWEHRTPIIPDWTYTTTLELDCSSLLALPLYALTNNIYLSYGIANIILLAAFIALIFFLFHGKCTTYPLLACNLICIPYSTGMLAYFNMLFFAGSQYILKATIPLLLISILLWIERNQAKRKLLYEYIPLIILEFFLFICSLSSGVYVLFMGVLPIFLTYILYKIIMYEKLPLLSYVLFGLGFSLCIAGIMLNNFYMNGTRGSSMVLISVYAVLANFYSCLAGIYELFGGIAYDMDIPALSLEGISILLKAVLVLIFFICGIIAITKIAKKKADLRIFLLMSVFIWNLFVLLSTLTRAGSVTYEYRYHLNGMLPLICISVIILVDAWLLLKPHLKTFWALCSICLIVALNVLSFSTFITATDKTASLKALCSYCDILDLDYVYMYNASNDADMCRLITQSDAHYLCVIPDDGITWAYDYYAKYSGGPLYPENAIFVAEDIYEFGDSFEAFGYKFEKFDTIANQNLYYFAQ